MWSRVCRLNRYIPIVLLMGGHLDSTQHLLVFRSSESKPGHVGDGRAESARTTILDVQGTRGNGKIEHAVHAWK